MPNQDWWLIFKTKKEGNAPKELSDDLKNVKQGLAGAVEGLTGMSLASFGVAGAIAGLGAGLKASIDAALEAESIQADLAATLKSTHGAAGLTADEINRMATNFSNLTGIEDDSIVKSQAMLLTFTKIGKDVFPDATMAILNMSSKMGGMESATIQVGKALNDPIQGVSALRKVGVQLTVQQEEQIRKFVELGDVASAQKIILAELGTEFGGLAEAMGETTQGKINKAKNAIGNLGETIGGLLLPALGKAADLLTEAVQAVDSLAHRNENLDAVLQQHSNELVDVSRSYEDYAREMTRASLVAGGFDSSQKSVDRAMQNMSGRLSETLGEWGLYTEEQYNAKIAADQVTATLESQQSAFENNLKQVAEAPLRFDEYTGSLDEARTSQEAFRLEIEKTSLAALTDSMKNYTIELLYNKAAAGLDAEAATTLAASMGLIDEKTAYAMGAVEKLRARFDSGAISANEYAFMVKKLNDEISGLHDKSVTITMNEVTNRSSNNAGGGRFGGEQYASGGSFTIPPGYENHTWPVGPNKWARSGEEVIIKPAGQSASNRSATIGTVVINNDMDIETFKRLLVQAMR